MDEEKAGSRTAPDDITAGASVAADRAGQASDRYEVRPVAWVESPLKHRAQAPRQSSEGAPIDAAIRDTHAATYDERIIDGMSGHYLL